MAWSTADRVRLVQLYYQSGSLAQARRTFMREGNRRYGPTVKTIKQLVAHFEEGGNVGVRPYKRERKSIAVQAVRKIRRAIASNPKLSIRRLSLRTDVSRSTIQRILRKWLRLYPFKIQLTQKLKRGDKASRIRFCRWMAAKLRTLRFKRNLFMTDEANFYLDGVVNKQNCRIWGSERPNTDAAVAKEQFPPLY